MEKTGFASIQMAPERRKEKPAPLEISPLGVGKGEMRHLGQTPRTDSNLTLRLCQALLLFRTGT
jgi:hypothetical protein